LAHLSPARFERINRMGCSLKVLVLLVTGFQNKGIHFVSPHDRLLTQ
jgi:DNA invertase Pin-like site-specific DNA recombinase